MNSKVVVAVALVLCVAAPILLSRKDGSGGVSASDADRRISIISPHNETIRREFGEAFQEWWKKKTGETVYVNWMTPGGTSEIRKILNTKFAAAEKVGDEGVGIDVFFGGGDYDFRKQAEAGHLAKLEVFKKHPKWFADDVNVNEDKLYSFVWDGELNKAKIVSVRTNHHAKFEFVGDDDDPNYVEFRLEMNELTQEVYVRVTDYSDMDPEEAQELWESLQ